MPLTLLFFLLIVGIGLCALRLLRLDRAWLGLALAAPTGLAVAAIVTTWADRAPVPEPVELAMLLVLAAAGFATAWPRVRALRRAPAVAGLLGLAVLAPFVIISLSFGTLEVPFSGHDGAHHVETIAALERGVRWAGWYPPGFHTTLAAFLNLAPWVDLARGATDTAFGIALLAPLAVFGLGYALSGQPGVAALGALFLAFTVQYPYTPQLWSGWPVATALLLAIGLWSVGAVYLRRPRPGLPILAGLLLGAILLMHGTELYTAAIGLLVLLAAGWRRIVWRRLLVRDLPLAGLIAAGVALPYLATLLGWAHAGGATQTAQEVLQVAAADQPSLGDAVITLALGALSGGFLVDLPLRAGLLGIALWAAVRHKRDRVLASLFAIFFGLALVFRYATLPGVSTLYAITFPWAEWIRLLMVASVVASLLQASALAALRARLTLPRSALAPALAASGLLLAGCTWGTSQALTTASASLATYSADDAAAMSWLRVHAQPGDLVANDYSGDAGIWAPYKANVSILAPRLGLARPDERPAQEQVLDNVAQLDRVADAACGLGVRYVYHGSRPSHWEARHFPSLDELRASPALEEVFASGEAVVFRVNLACGS